VALKPVLDAFAVAEVVDKDGKVIPDAKVYWMSETEGCVPRDPANPGAKTAVGAGNHTANASAPGYRPNKGSVSVKSGETGTVRIVLEPTQTVVKDNKIMILTPVYFDYNKDTIKSESFQILNDVAQTLTEHPELLKVEVAGHTDSDGSDTYNEDLSQRRVESVRRYLIEKGINGDRLVAKGYGESKPIASNKTDEGKAKNRRVELVITERATPEGQGAGKNR
jgi:outer membrane protein OmpA-like peptidoglycan-associated protein